MGDDVQVTLNMHGILNVPVCDDVVDLVPVRVEHEPVNEAVEDQVREGKQVKERDLEEVRL